MTSLIGPLATGDVAGDTLAELHAYLHRFDEDIAHGRHPTAAENANFKSDQATFSAELHTGGAAAIGTTPPSPEEILKKAGVSGVPSTSPGLIGKAAGLIGEAGEAATNEPAKLAGEGASAAAGQVVSWVQEAFGADLVKGLLYVLLAGGGAALIITGFSRATGTHPARTIAKTAAAGAAVA